MDIGKVVSDYLKHNGMTQAEFRRRSGDRIARTTLSNAVTKRNYKPSPQNLEVIADVMGLSVDDLLRKAKEASNESD
ncbi:MULTISPECIES: helix-turn-helix domain-containing protein [Weissella]|jgi:transcriptional regulator with XRE-family HTH domain|uniref:Helix-turn-helix transcriptional regulator n=1 Tax=Weissella confusa TaxID=1583 RepID=A0A923NJ21_WEICO|nr:MULTISPECIES: helix-turn-helix transcriptional regulator [Weissella]MBC6499199.1 helix-turn-helix transcriptional regulator [Weissella confusa]MBD1502925.1 XRE family transcriptional regulator [Weissella cibaria]MBJ7657983.1 helix-turn-helix transcriptional regulator [Weissella confusa]MBJ7689462.1 helix-turn-helix transcriptional regulator [Weissella confusa]MCW0927901.1 helix-turn-helix domain-containing protein [Weissella sp. LMG 11983]